MHDLSETIAAIATAPGRGSVGCVRLSGPGAHDLADRLFRPSSDAAVARDAPRFGRFLGRSGEAIDHGYLVKFQAERSFTGETTAEIWAHGSPPILAELVAAAVEAGARPAGPGEFAYRALRNGRLDLTRAEAIRDLVAARTLYQARVAFLQACGALSRRVVPIREALADVAARVEASIEFEEEAETRLEPGALRGVLTAERDACAALLRGFRSGRVVRDGATAVIAGLPNVGKSSLFNRLLERERAIVSPSPGTTRDTLHETLDIGGIPVRLVDTAGLRDSGEPIEAEGVRRAREAVGEADLVVRVLDATREPTGDELRRLEACTGDGEPRTTIHVANKCDLEVVRRVPSEVLRVSALTGQGLDALREEIHRRLAGAGTLEDPILTDVRHATAIGAALAALDRALAAERAGMPEEIVIEDVAEALDRLGELAGDLGAEDLYERIFSTFCIGK